MSQEEKAPKIEVEEVERPQLKRHDLKLLDLAFAMDCTGSMGSYIHSATENIRKIVEEIVASEKGDVRLALVEYRDHPPQDHSFVTRVNDFTNSPNLMKEWLSCSEAAGGGDTPEAVADALHDILKLSWRDDATKICVCISDAPPHGLSAAGDSFPDGCPAGIDPVAVTHQMAEKGITLYMIGCEPSISPYRDFFMAIAFITGGQYVPLSKAQLLTQVIIGGAREEMSLEQFMHEVNEELEIENAAGRQIDEEDFTRRVHTKMLSKGIKTKQLHHNKEELGSAIDSLTVKKLTGLKSLQAVREIFKSSEKDFFPADEKYMMPMRFACLSAPMFGSASPHMDENDECADKLDELLVKERVQPEPEECYDTVEGDISYAQSSRMVQRCLKRNLMK